MEEVSEGNASEHAADAVEQRLEELRRVTREYAEYSGQSYGLGGLAAAAIFVVHAVVYFEAPRWLPISRILGGMVWVWALTLARRWYQRSGIVTAREPEPDPLPPRLSTWVVPLRVYSWMLYFGITFTTWDLAERFPRGEEGPLYTTVYLGALAVVPGLYAMASKVMRGDGDSMITAFVVSIPMRLPWDLRESGPQQLLQLGVMLLVMVVLVDRSVEQHRDWRRVAQRLAFVREALR